MNAPKPQFDKQMENLLYEKILSIVFRGHDENEINYYWIVYRMNYINDLDEIPKEFEEPNNQCGVFMDVKMFV